jgi:hypothetical protein
MAGGRRSSASRGHAPARQSVRRWLVLRVVLRGQGGDKLDAAPGRDLLVSSEHTFAELAGAIDRAFARWDISHLHEFDLPDGRRIVGADDEDAQDGDLDETVETLDRIDLAVGASFVYIFDLGAMWEHDCRVLRDRVDPIEEAGVVPREVVPVFGWGMIPDQYGRVTADESSP